MVKQIQIVLILANFTSQISDNFNGPFFSLKINNIGIDIYTQMPFMY